MPWSGNECGKNECNENLKAVIPNADYDRNNQRLWNISTVWVA